MRYDLPPIKWTGLGSQSLGMSWAEITQSRVQAAGIVEALAILEQIASGIGAGSVNPVMNPLGLERVKEAFHRCVVETIAFAAHRRRDAEAGENTTIGFGGVVATRSLSADRRNWSSASAGVFQSSVFRGRELRAVATAAISSAP